MSKICLQGEHFTNPFAIYWGDFTVAGTKFKEPRSLYVGKSKRYLIIYNNNNNNNTYNSLLPLYTFVHIGSVYMIYTVIKLSHWT